MRIILVLPFPGNRLYSNRFLYPSFTFTSMFILSYLKHARTHAHTHTYIRLKMQCPSLYLYMIFTYIHSSTYHLESYRTIAIEWLGWVQSHRILMAFKSWFHDTWPRRFSLRLDGAPVVPASKGHTEECHPRAARHGPGEGEGKAATNANIMRVCSSFQSF